MSKNRTRMSDLRNNIKGNYRCNLPYSLIGGDLESISYDFRKEGKAEGLVIHIKGNKTIYYNFKLNTFEELL